MAECGIDHSSCVTFEHSTPMSIILVNAENGSRTIVHHRGKMPEITFQDFKKLDLTKYSWFHFEGMTVTGMCMTHRYDSPICVTRQR